MLLLVVSLLFVVLDVHLEDHLEHEDDEVEEAEREVGPIVVSTITCIGGVVLALVFELLVR